MTGDEGSEPKVQTAVLTGPPVPGSPLARDLQALGFTIRVAETVSALTVALAAVPAGERVAVVDPRFVGHRHSLRLSLTDPRHTAAAAPGALTVLPPGRGALRDAVASVAAGAATAGRVPSSAPANAALAGPAPPPVPPPGPLPPELTEALAARLHAAGTPVHRPELGPLVATVPATPADRAMAAAAVTAVDEEAVRLRAAVKAHDGLFATYGVSPYSRHVARWCARRGVTPNQVTLVSLLTAVAGAGCVATGTRVGYLVAAALLMGSFVLDCADGQLARYTLRFSALGAWLDGVCDRVKEYAFYAGLALGAAREGDDVWGLALGAMTLLTCRHTVDFAFAATRPSSPDSTRSRGGETSPVRAGWSRWVRRVIVLPIGERWAVIAVLTALTTPRTTFTVLLAASGVAAGATTAGRLLRTARALAADRPGSTGRGPGPVRPLLAGPPTPATTPAGQALAALADSGPLAASTARLSVLGVRRARGTLAAPLWALTGTTLLLGALMGAGAGGWYAPAAAGAYALCAGRAITAPLTRSFDWLTPPLFRAGEHLAVLILALHSEANGTLPAAFLLVAACAYHHYDTAYRLRGSAGTPPRRLVRALGGHEGRTVLVATAAALWGTGQGFATALTVLGAALALLALLENVYSWVSSHPPAGPDETGEPA